MADDQHHHTAQGHGPEPHDTDRHGDHGHTHGAVDPSLWSNERGLWAVKWSFLGLSVTALLQLAVVLLSHSVALLADTIHNFGEAGTGLPLAVAFLFANRPPNRRFQYGYGRVEDLAGLAVVLTILVSAGVAGYEAIHAAGVFLGYPIADPVIGLLITVAILGIVWQLAGTVLLRMLDGIEPEVLDEIGHAAGHVPGVVGVTETRARWVGHRLRVEANVSVRPTMTVAEGHRVAKEVERELRRHLPFLAGVIVHVDPATEAGEEHHRSAEPAVHHHHS